MNISYRKIRAIGFSIFVLAFLIGCLIAYLALKKNSDNLSILISVEKVKLDKWYDLSKIISDSKDSINNYSFGRIEVISPALLLINNAFNQINIIRDVTVEEEEKNTLNEIEYGVKVLRQAAIGYQHEIKLGQKNGTSGKELEEILMNQANSLSQLCWAAVDYINSKIEIKHKEIIRGTIFTKYLLITSMFFGIICLIIFSVVMNRALAKPIDKLVDATKRIAKGDLRYEITMKSNDEIGVLASAFNRMVGDLRMSRSLLVDKDYVDSIIANMGESLIVAGPDGRIKTVNQETINLLGYERDEITGKEISIIFPGSMIFGKAVIKNQDTTVRTKNGKNIPAIVSMSNMNDESGMLLGTTIIARDITEHKKKEEEINNLKKYSENIIESIPTALIACDKELKIKIINKTCCNFFGVRKDDIVGKHLDAVFGEEIIRNKKLDVKVLEIFRTGAVSDEMEVRYNFPKVGEKVLVLKIAGIIHEGEALLLLNDITEKRHLEEQLVFTERMAVIGQLAAGISHEFNNLLAVIRSSTEFYGKTGRKSDIVRAYKNTIECVDKGSEIVKNLLSFSKRKVERKEEVYIISVIEDVLALIKTDLDKNGVEVIKEFHQIPPILANVGQIQQVFLNIIINAKQSFPEAGGRLKIFAESKGKNILIKFSNNGKIIDEENIDKIFNPFFTTKGGLGGGDTGGTGLGLSVSYGIIQAHGGAISVKSNKKEGTIFIINLPIIEIKKSA